MPVDIRADFPLLKNHLENGQPLTYLDSAATAQKPSAVIDAVRSYYENGLASPHRGAYALSADATALYEGARQRAADFIGAASAEEIVFTKNATDALNLVALSWGEGNIGEGDEILLSIAEHHSNLLPWQALAKRKGAKLVYMYTDAGGHLPPSAYAEKINSRTKLVALAHVSNVLGLKNPVAQVAAAAHAVGVKIVVDGAQSVPHMPVNVADLGADFLAFSGHKMMGPDGIGVLWTRREILQHMPPVVLGGGIVEQVTEQEVRLLDGPIRFEAGTPDVEAAVGLAAAMDYLDSVGLAAIHRHETELTRLMVAHMQELPGVELYGDVHGKCGIVAFNVQDVHPHDVASILDAAGVTVRAGHHCAQPLLRHMGLNACCRASLYAYNNQTDIERFITALAGVREVLGLGPA